MKTKPKRSRKQRFKNWWNKKHHSTRAHKWLVKNARRVAFAYYLPPDLFEDVVYISKKFNNSEYKRLSQQDAWCLWRVCNPTVNQRTEILIRAARNIDESVTKLEELKLLAKGKTPREIPPMRIGPDAA